LYRWVEHTGELELEITAPTEKAVFEDGFKAMTEVLVCDSTAPLERREVTLTAADRPALLADWLAELAFLAESDGLAPVNLESLELEGTTLRAAFEGRICEPAQLVKGVTYHRLALEPAEGGFRATVVLDV